MKSSLSLTVLCAVVLLALGAQAGTYSFSPTPVDLGDLDHNYWYTWGISGAIPFDEGIIEAVLFFDDINDWTNEANDRLYIHLLDNPTVGVVQGLDYEGGGDKFAGQGKWIATYTDTNSYTEDLSYTFSTLGLIDDLNSYATNGVFGFGMDPDCHYNNKKITFTITTEKAYVPEPSGLIALATGLVSLGGLVVRKKRAF